LLQLRTQCTDTSLSVAKNKLRIRVMKQLTLIVALAASGTVFIGGMDVGCCGDPEPNRGPFYGGRLVYTGSGHAGFLWHEAGGIDGSSATPNAE
jgi:hypothetical protein